MAGQYSRYGWRGGFCKAVAAEGGFREGVIAGDGGSVRGFYKGVMVGEEGPVRDFAESRFCKGVMVGEGGSVEGFAGAGFSLVVTATGMGGH